jgi:ABC-2 type transport system permease protein
VIEPLKPVSRLTFSVRDTVTATRRYILREALQPEAVILTMIMPVIMVVLFAYVFGSSITVPGGHYRSYLMSGMFAQGTLFAAGGVAVAVATDMREGVIDRLKTMPIARPSVLVGRSLATGIAGIPSLTVMTVCAYFVGWRPMAGLGHTIGAFCLLFAFSWAMVWVGVAIGLFTSGPEAANQISMLPALLLGFVSNVFVDPARMPAWLRLIADWNPVSAVVAAARELFGTIQGPAPSNVLTLRHPVITTIAMTVLLIAIVLPLSVRRYSMTGQ